MAFGTAGSSGGIPGAPPSVADALLYLLQIMADPKAAKEYLLKIKAEREEIEKQIDELARERADFVNEKTAHKEWIDDQKKTLVEQEGFLKNKIANHEARMAEEKKAADDERAQTTSVLERVKAQQKDYERRLAMIREAAA